MKPFLAPVALLSMLVALPAHAGEVKLQVANGRITLQARDATVREILSEWARLGQVKIVNAEKIAGAPVTLEMQDVPEAQALTTLLRSVSGYMAAPRTQLAASASIYDRIVIMAAPRMQTAARAGYAASPAQPNVYRQGIVQAQFSYSSAVGLFNSALNFIILLAANTASRRLSETSLF